MLAQSGNPILAEPLLSVYVKIAEMNKFGK